MTVDFVIVNYKCDKDTGQLIHNIGESFEWPHTITVIDNSVENRGFSKAANLGASIGSGDIIAFMNPDLKLAFHWADSTMAVLDTDPNVVICGPRLIDGFEWPRDVSGNGIHDWVCGACYFVRRDFFESRGGFDERYFFGYEETDLIRQAESLGYRCQSVDTRAPLVRHVNHGRGEFHTKQLIQANAKFREKWGQ